MLSESSRSAHLCLFIIILNIHLANSTNICNKKEQKEKPFMPAHPVAARDTEKESNTQQVSGQSFQQFLSSAASDGVSAWPICFLALWLCFFYQTSHTNESKPGWPWLGFSQCSFRPRPFPFAVEYCSLLLRTDMQHLVYNLSGWQADRWSQVWGWYK